MEAINLRKSGKNEVFGTLLHGDNFPKNIHTTKTFSPKTSVVDTFHTYAIEWEKGEIRWYIDGEHYQTQKYTSAGAYPAPFNQSFYLILNVAVGGDLPGGPTPQTPFPQTMEVDYVRVFQKPPSITPPKSDIATF
ncbi:hypothetical protein GCM10007877_27380 [Marinibactrum halimedae]|uniref:GH16 domain-containing protein n=2 Tax=Marinibactrum halimedae TaxID=1444977 RepID=A0AA37WM74_9GAMM|nr:hypothetical protein GCM10007877_27380 [Marinibactrum halimedae]